MGVQLKKIEYIWRELTGENFYGKLYIIDNLTWGYIPKEFTQLPFDLTEPIEVSLQIKDTDLSLRAFGTFWKDGYIDYINMNLPFELAEKALDNFSVFLDNLLSFFKNLENIWDVTKTTLIQSYLKSLLVARKQPLIFEFLAEALYPSFLSKPYKPSQIKRFITTNFPLAKSDQKAQEGEKTIYTLITEIADLANNQEINLILEILKETARIENLNEHSIILSSLKELIEKMNEAGREPTTRISELGYFLAQVKGSGDVNTIDEEHIYRVVNPAFRQFLKDFFDRFVLLPDEIQDKILNAYEEMGKKGFLKISLLKENFKDLIWNIIDDYKNKPSLTETLLSLLETYIDKNGAEEYRLIVLYFDGLISNIHENEMDKKTIEGELERLTDSYEKIEDTWKEDFFNFLSDLGSRFTTEERDKIIRGIEKICDGHRPPIIIVGLPEFLVNLSREHDEVRDKLIQLFAEYPDNLIQLFAEYPKTVRELITTQKTEQVLQVLKYLTEYVTEAFHKQGPTTPQDFGRATQTLISNMICNN